MISKELAKRIDDYVESRREDILHDLAELVAIPSVSKAGSPEPHPFGDDCAKVLDAALNMAKRHNMKTYNGGYWYGLATRGEGRHSIGIFSHLDIVEVNQDDWIYPAFEMTERDGWVIGRGVDDDKNAAVLGMYVNDTLNAVDAARNTKLVLYLGQNEEKGMADLDRYLAENLEPDFSMVPDFLFPVSVGEGGSIRGSITAEESLEEFTGFAGGKQGERFPVTACITYTGSKAAEMKAAAAGKENITAEETEAGLLITAQGFAGTSMFSDDKVSGISVLSSFLLQTGLLSEKDTVLMKGINAVTTDTKGKGIGIAYEADRFLGGALSILCNPGTEEDGKVKMNLRLNFPKGVDAQKTSEILGDFCKANGLVLNVTGVTEASIYPKDAPQIQCCVDAWNEVCGKDAGIQFGGGTYARKLKNGVGYGPKTRISPDFLPKGHGMLHSPDEATNIQSLLDAIKTYTRAVIYLDEYYSKQ